MCIRLPYNPIATDRVSLGAEITGNDTCRNPAGPRQDCEGGCIVLTKTLTGIEQKSIGSIAFKPRRGEGVIERLFTEQGQYAAQVTDIITVQ